MWQSNTYTQETATSTEHFKSLVATVQELSLCRSLEAVMRLVRTRARELTGADGATFVLRDKDKCHYADEDAISPLWKGQRFPMSSCISGWAMLNKQPAIIPDIYVDSRIPVDAYRPTFVKSLVMVPIRSMDPIGAIGTYWAETRMPTEEEVAMLQSLADITAVTMENVKVYNDLEQLVLERTGELIDSLNREKEMNKVKSNFVSLASHELRTPLSTILSSTSLLETHMGAAIEEKSSKHIVRIKSSVKHLMNMLNDFLTMGKLEQGKADVTTDALNLRSFMQEIFEEMEGTLKQGQYIRHQHTGTTDIRQDGKILRNIMLNLLSNACKYSADNKSIDVITDVCDGVVTLLVKDQGIGIPKEEQQHIFNNFFRARNVNTIQGTGLGLNIVKRYIELLHGTIQFTSVENQGTTFTLQFKSER